MKSKSLIEYYYGFQVFFSLLLWIPIFYEYQKRIGLTDAEIFGIQSVYYTAFCLFEIPTGVFADAWGYRTSLRLGAVLGVVGNFLPALAPSYWSFLFHFLLVALSRSLISGASSAYLYEGLKAQGADPSEYKRIEGNSRSYGLIAKVAIWPFIGFLMEWKLSLPYTLTTVGALVAVVFAWLLPQEAVVQSSPVGASHAPGDGPSRGSKQGAQKRLQSLGNGIAGHLARLGQMVRVIPQTPLIPLLIVQGLAAFILPRIIQTNLFQPVLGGKGFGVSSYGICLAAASVFEAAGSSYPTMKQLLRCFSEWNAVLGLTLVMAITLCVIPVTGPVATLASLMLFSLAAGMIFPIQKQLMNDAISSSPEAARYRATVLSLESIVDRAVCAWVVGWIGVYMSHGQLDRFLVLSAVLSSLAVFLLSGFARSRWGFAFIRSAQGSK